MNIKRIAALAVATALMSAAPAFAATKTGNVTVKWNTQLTATLTIHTDYDATGNKNATAAAILLQNNGGSGTCPAADPTNADLTVDFGNVSPDATKYTDCLYKNAVNAAITTNSANWNLAVAATAGYTAANGTVCAFANGTWPTAAVTQTVRAAAVTLTSAGTCTGGNLMDTTGSTLVSSTTAGNWNVGQDIELVLPPNAPGGANVVTETYTLTYN